MSTTEASGLGNPARFGNIIIEKPPDVPAFEQVLQDVRPLLIMANQALEDAIRQAKEFFDEEGTQVDRYLFNDLVRYYAKRWLQGAGLSVEDDVEEFADYEFKVLANNGLCGSFKGYSFRILKADHGELPVPGPSRPKQAFYNQQLPLLLDMPSGAISRPNILVLWEVDAAHNFAQLRLSCPKKGGKTRDSVEAYFNEPILHAAEMVKTKAKAITVEGTAGLEEIPITRKEPETVPEDAKWSTPSE